MRMSRFGYHCAGAVLLIVVATGRAHATPGECQREIIKQYRIYTNHVMRALQPCEDKIVQGHLPPGYDCQSDIKVTAKLTLAKEAFSHHVNSACGGNNHTCNTGDTGKNADETLSSVGWDIGACPDFESAGCTNAIADCNDIVACIECIADVAAPQALALYYDALNIPASDRALEKCQREIGKRGAKFFTKKAGLVETCERHVLSGDVAPPCPDAPTQQLIGKSDSKAKALICAKCGGADKLCGGGDDRTTSEIGFVSTCPNVTIPGGSSCGGPIATVTDITTCVSCVSEFKVDCLDALSVPGLKGYPAECNPGP